MCCIAAACAGDAEDRLVVRADSAGVTIVESSGPEWSRTPGWTLDSVPAFALTGTGNAYEFARVTDATFLSSSQLVVLDEGADAPVRWHGFDPEGAWQGDLVTPARLQVLEVGIDYVLGVRRDEYDVQYVETLTLTR